MRFCVFVLFVSFHCPAWAEKQFRPGEAELSNKVIADVNAGKYVEAIADVDAWEKAIPDTDYRNERAAFYIQACAGANRPKESLDAAVRLLDQEFESLFEGPQAPYMQIRLMYNVAWAIRQLPDPTPQQMRTARKAAGLLAGYDRPLPGVDSAKWAEARADMKLKASTALFYLDMLPGAKAMATKPPDCATAQAAYEQAVAKWPERAASAWELGRALNCSGKNVAAIYQFQRATALDATLGDPRNDATKMRNYADNAYVKFHGGRDGLEELKALVKSSPFPPPTYTIESGGEIALARQQAFEKEHPQAALWMKIRERLTAEDGTRYFEDELKGTAVPRLAGTLVAATPACRPKELKVMIAIPDVETARPEITLKLDRPLAGRPELGTGLQWEGSPIAFEREPLSLTIAVEASSLSGMKTTACGPKPAMKPTRR